MRVQTASIALRKTAIESQKPTTGDKMIKMIDGISVGSAVWTRRMAEWPKRFQTGDREKS
jgi:hypothetical protein